MTEKVPIHALEAGKDAQSTLIGPLARALGHTLTIGGSHRFRFEPLPSEPVDAYVQRVTSATMLADELAERPGMVIVAGHGSPEGADSPSGNGAEWTLWQQRNGQKVASMADLAQELGSRRIAADFLVISSCHAERAQQAWRRLLNPDGIALIGNGVIDHTATGQWLAAVMSAVTRRPGPGKPTPDDWRLAVDTARATFLADTSEGKRGTRPSLCDAMIDI